jgi:hypothetical protein
MRLVLILLALSACARVKPWERELLAKPKMMVDGDREAALLEQHVYEYREGAAGGYGGGGGGCGCN